MNRETLMTLISGAVVITAVLLQSTIFRYLAFWGIKPDLTLICIVWFSVNQGRNSGQILGFLSGIVQDSLSIAPLGFHSLIKTLLGYLLGHIHGLISLDRILFPVIFVAVSTTFKQVMSLAVDKLFNANMNIEGIFTTSFFIELGYNILLTPVIFLLLSLLNKKVLAKRERA